MTADERVRIAHSLWLQAWQAAGCTRQLGILNRGTAE